MYLSIISNSVQYTDFAVTGISVVNVLFYCFYHKSSSNYNTVWRPCISFPWSTCNSADLNIYMLDLTYTFHSQTFVFSCGKVNFQFFVQKMLARGSGFEYNFSSFLGKLVGVYCQICLESLPQCLDLFNICSETQSILSLNGAGLLPFQW